MFRLKEIPMMTGRERKNLQLNLLYQSRNNETVRDKAGIHVNVGIGKFNLKTFLEVAQFIRD